MPWNTSINGFTVPLPFYLCICQLRLFGWVQVSVEKLIAICGTWSLEKFAAENCGRCSSLILLHVCCVVGALGDFCTIESIFDIIM